VWRVFPDLSKKGLNLRIIELIKRILRINPRIKDQEVIEEKVEKVLDKDIKVKKEAKKSNPKSKKTVKKKKKK